MRTHYLMEPGSSSKVRLLVWLVKKDLGRGIVVLRDPSGLKEVRLVGGRAGDLLKLPCESLVVIEGCYSVDGLLVESYRVLHKPIEEPGIDYTVLPSDVRVLAKYSPWYMKHPLWMKIIRLQHITLYYIREFLYSRGFLELLSPMVSVAGDPGLRGARKLHTKLYGVDYELTSSVIMYKQVSAGIFEKIFFVARNVREEPSENISTGRHLVEFTQIDIEWALASLDDVIKLAEDLLEYVTRKLIVEHSDLVYSLNKEFEPLKPPFKKIRYTEALEIAKKLGYSVEWGEELSHEAEASVANYFSEPLWITHFPVISRGFYYLPEPSDPRYNMDFNLILPKGYGEVIDGGVREYRLEEVRKRIIALGEPIEKYSWFLDTIKKGGVPPSAGWGLGLERLTRYIAGVEHIVLATLFPKLPGLPKTP